ncbi:hypothetical protein IW262DRAFT_1298001 [Armillaria fumosa]|nr:hypothetical protein IW262DRAFT_1298001 [Armillaria fumosa]
MTGQGHHTHRVVVTISDELKKHTQEEIRQSCNAKNAAMRDAKQKAKDAKDVKAKVLIQRVTAQQNQQALEDKHISSLHLDLETVDDPPSFSATIPIDSKPFDASLLPSTTLQEHPVSPSASNTFSHASEANIEPPPTTGLSIDTDSEPGLTINDLDDGEASDGAPSQSRLEDIGLQFEDESSHDDYVEGSGADSDGSDLEHRSSRHLSQAEVASKVGVSNEVTSGDDDIGDVKQMEEWQLEFQVFLEQKQANLKAANTIAGRPKESLSAVTQGLAKKEKHTAKVGAASESTVTEKKTSTSTTSNVKKNCLEVRHAIDSAHVKTQTVSAISATISCKCKDPDLKEKNRLTDPKKCLHTEETQVGGASAPKNYRNSGQSNVIEPAPADHAQVIIVKMETGIDAGTGLAGEQVAVKRNVAQNQGMIVLKTADVKKNQGQEAWEENDLPLWQQKLIPSILDWSCGEIKEPFSATGLPEFKTAMWTLWTQIFAHLPVVLADGSVRADSHVISSVWYHILISVGLRQQQLFAPITVKSAKEWVQVQLVHCCFLYTNPDAAEGLSDEGCDAFRGCLVLETFAYHLQATINAPYSYGNLAAGLALAAAADMNARNSEYSFKDNPWETTASKYYVQMSTLTDEKWKIIINKVLSYISGKNRKSKTGLMLAGETG